MGVVGVADGEADGTADGDADGFVVGTLVTKSSEKVPNQKLWVTAPFPSYSVNS